MSATNGTTDQPPAPSEELWVCELGMVPYRDALTIQAQVRERVQAQELPNVLLLLEHPPVYTRGRRSREDELALGEDFYRARGIDVVTTDRGGRVTYHGPGQLVGYPIMHISDIGAHLRLMEQAILAALCDHGLAARSRCEEGPDYTGVWVENRKIASIGVHVSRGVSTHGFAVNLQNDLEPFSWVIPCGLPGVMMTSLELEMSTTRSNDRPSGSSQFKKDLVQRFCEVHSLRERPISLERLGLRTSAVAVLA